VVAVKIEVRGIPAPQGSKRHVGRGIMVESSKAVGPWREAVRAETQSQMGLQERDAAEGPVSVLVYFYLPRPSSISRKILWPFKRPDLDKLGRAVLDGLTEGGAWLDDGQVVRLMLEKRYAGRENPPGATIHIMGVRE
jgi:crossover junction endodeoxyribonuclease RusA